VGRPVAVRSFSSKKGRKIAIPGGKSNLVGPRPDIQGKGGGLLILNGPRGIDHE